MASLIRLLLILLPLSATAQDRRWTLLPDSTVAGVTYQDLRLAATYRLAQNSLTRSAVLEIVALNSEADHLREALDLQRKAKEAAKAQAELCEGLRMDLQGERDKYARQAQRRGRNTLLFTLAGVLVGIILTR